VHEDIQNRNKRVESDKAWETSLTRRSIITLVTYLVVGFYLNLLKVDYAWLHALVPPAAYVLSTLSLGFVKKIWLKKIYAKKDNTT
tara:strand:+ start:4954 stop:5211 length:258 start_codon:yes stop_codon:yes gene_type:complete